MSRQDYRASKRGGRSSFLTHHNGLLLRRRNGDAASCPSKGQSLIDGDTGRQDNTEGSAECGICDIMIRSRDSSAGIDGEERHS